MSANIIISNDSTKASSGILASRSNEKGLSTIFSYNGSDITFKTLPKWRSRLKRDQMIIYRYLL